MDDVPLQMIPYFVTCHVNCHTVLNYIDAAQSIGLPGDPCPMCQAEAGLSILDDMPDYFPFLVTSNEACDGGRVSINGRTAKAGAEVKPGDVIEIGFGERRLRVEVVSTDEHASRTDAPAMYRQLE